MQPQDPYAQPPQPAQPVDPSPPNLADLPAQPLIPDLPDAALPEIEMPYTTPPVPVVASEPVPFMPPQPQAPPPPMPPASPDPYAAAPAPEPNHSPLLPQQNQGSPAIQATDGDQGRSHLSSVGKKYFKYVEFDKDEVLLAEIRKHPFGLFIIVLSGAVIALVLLAAVVVLASSSFLSTVGFSDAGPIVVFAGFLLSLFIMGATLINAHLYRNNVVYVTNEKLAQILFITLFNRKLSQLSIGDVQDVTVQQNGFLPNLLGYGTLVVETAGEQQNYTFSFVPKPFETSKVIINAHETNLKLYGN